MLRLGVIGCGVRAAWVAACLRQADDEVTLGVVADPDEQSARRRLDDAKVNYASARFVHSAEQLLEHSDQLDGIIIATRCNLHAPTALKIAPTGLPVFLEKPVAITLDELYALHRAYRERLHSVVVSFPLRMTPVFQKVLDIIRSGRLGTINQVQATNNVPYGGVYFATWYRDFDSTGGLWVQKATHDFDCINLVVGAASGAAPVGVVATSTQKIYRGDMPAGLRCSQCAVSGDCPESPAAIARRDDDGGMGRDDHDCVFSRDMRHHDAGSALLLYSDGTHATYSQNFVSRRSAAVRGARITGYLATLIFDWYTESIQILEHHGKEVENIHVAATESHCGGDAALARNFVDVMRGEALSQSSLHDGIVSAAMCLAARESEMSRRVEPLAISDASPRVEVSVAVRTARAAHPMPAFRGDGATRTP